MVTRSANLCPRLHLGRESFEADGLLEGNNGIHRHVPRTSQQSGMVSLCPFTDQLLGVETIKQQLD